MAEAGEHWQTRPEAGSSSGLRLLMWVARHLGRRTLFALLKPVALYFMLVRGPERRASRDFLTRALGRRAGWRAVYRHFLRFAEVTADRFFILAGRDGDIPVRFVLDERFASVLESGRPGVFLAAHFGSFEAARVKGPLHGGINLRIVLDKQVNARFVALMQEVDPDAWRPVIDSEQGAVALGLEIAGALKDGDWVGFLADRHRHGDRVMQQSFLNAPAYFPTGPYLIANTFRAPVIGTFCRITDAGYEVHCEVLAESVRWPRGAREEGLQALLGAYVQRLEHHVLAAPYGWFNFFDFWADARETDR